MQVLERITRRHALTGAAGGVAAIALGRTADAAPAATAKPIVSRGRTKIVVLGSQGGQQITRLTGSNLRCGTSVLIDVDGVLTVLDCGCGSAHRIAEAGYDMNAVRRIIITHCHFDHVADLGSIAGFAWSSGRNGADPNRHLSVYGPTGVKDYERGLKRAVRRSIADQEGPLAQRPRFDRFARWHEMEPPRRAKRVVEHSRIDVRAIRVKHGGIPAVGYRIRTPDVDIAFSGDRGANGDSFPSLVKGVEVLFHEIIDRDLVIGALKTQGAAPSFLSHLINDHCDPETVGRVATNAGAGTLVLYHLIPGNPAITDAAWTALVTPYFAGQIIVARDLMTV